MIGVERSEYGRRWLIMDGVPELLFTENETNFERLFGVANPSPYVKDAFHEYLIAGRKDAVNPACVGTKAAAHYPLEDSGPGSATIRLRLTNHDPHGILPDSFGEPFADTFDARIAEAAQFYAAHLHGAPTDDPASVQRQAFAGLLWSKQSYHYDVKDWLEGDPGQPPPPPERKFGRNHNWTHLYNADVLSMPDKWEFPWYASWDMAFHCVAMAVIDPDFAKDQLILLLREWYMQPNGQLPAYEWAFGDVNPPVHAWAAWRVYKIEKRMHGRADRSFLERVFHKLCEFHVVGQSQGSRRHERVRRRFPGAGQCRSVRSLRAAAHRRTPRAVRRHSWMAMYCLNMLAIALELSREDPAYEDVASKFFEHFVYIAQAMNDVRSRRHRALG